MGQPDSSKLPYMSIVTEQGQNMLNWNSQYDGIKSIAVQRSTDSVRNFTTIGIINAPKKGMGAYKDQHPLVGNNYYRLSIAFSGDLEWFSNTYKVFLDSATIARSREARIQTGISKEQALTKTDSVAAAEAPSTDFYFTPSSKVFTNPYTGHINIVLPDAIGKRYNLRFFDTEKVEILRVSRITKATLVLDKNNFNSKGVFSFKLFEGTELIETGYITIY
jgi:hypothetical protein